MKNKKIVFIGGHHNSALVVAQDLKKKGHQIHWFGHKHTMKTEKSLSLEFQDIKKAGLPFLEIKTAKFYRTYNPFRLLKIFFGIGQSFYFLLKIKPHLVISLGGYLSFPVVLAARLLRIDCLFFEQTTRVGLANQILAPLAKQVLLTWPSSKEFFHSGKAKVIGLPLQKKVFKKEAPTSPFTEKLETILITGGKQGSHVINKAIEENLARFLEQFNIIHQTGGILKTGDFANLSAKRKSLPKKLQKRYLVRKFFFQEEMIKMIKLADLVISRSGAHIVYELAAMGKPALLIPFPWAYKQEQLANAQILTKAGSAIIIPQNQLTGTNLYKKTKYLINNLEKFKKPAKQLKKEIKTDAAEQMVKVIEKML
jgi:UDP-N-acetylglucosamine--N-acetylmuramyl-(pentapeptide) pyrophosphoryl-undecaprenol N-acetylglucosamine transferase